MNSGDWVENLSALEYASGEWNVFSFNEQDFEKIKLKTEKPVPDVSTDEVMFYINSLQGIH
jgi:hypothetical protein